MVEIQGLGVRQISDSLRTFKDTVDLGLLTSSGREIVEAEHYVPIDIAKDSSLRLKVIDNCGHACVFCHNEGTLVNEKQASLRVSVFLPDNFDSAQSTLNQYAGFRVLPMDVNDGYFREEIRRARDILGVDEVHLTGGEPTQHPRLPEIVKELTASGITVKMTSNGENGASNYKRLSEAGLKGVNVSIFGSTAAEYAQTQPSSYGIKWAESKLNLSRQAIAAARKYGIEVKSNCVMSNANQASRVKRLLERARNEDFQLRILNDLSKGPESIVAILIF